jgi:hypothetical protein
VKCDSVVEAGCEAYSDDNVGIVPVVAAGAVVYV